MTRHRLAAVAGLNGQDGPTPGMSRRHLVASGGVLLSVLAGCGQTPQTTVQEAIEDAPTEPPERRFVPSAIGRPPRGSLTTLLLAGDRCARWQSWACWIRSTNRIPHDARRIRQRTNSTPGAGGSPARLLRARTKRIPVGAGQLPGGIRSGSSACRHRASTQYRW